MVWEVALSNNSPVLSSDLSYVHMVLCVYETKNLVMACPGCDCLRVVAVFETTGVAAVTNYR